VPVFSPDLAHNNSGYNISFFGLFAAREAAHFWFRVRNDLIIWALGKYDARVSSFMEIGCGTGFVLQGIARCFPQIRLVGSEIYPEGIAFAAERVPQANFIQMDARQIPFVTEFDAVGAFDVIEHIEKDEAVLQQIYRALKPAGLLMLTVPQHRWLWSIVDANACHVRRYSMRELHDKLAIAGFTIIRSTSFVSILLPFMLISRLFKRDKTENLELQAELRINPIINRIFEVFLRLELCLIRMGVTFSVGGSRLIVATKVEKTDSNY
jgi:SAM-dependent methyltransferase